MQANFTLTGDKKLDRTLKEMEPKLAKKGIRKATRAAAKVVLADAKRRAPRGDTGKLERSLGVRTAKGGRGKRLRRGTIGHAVVTREGLFSGEAFYGGFLEFGTKNRRTKRGRIGGTGAISQDAMNRGRIAQGEFSFIRPALYGNERLIRWMFKRTLAKAINDIAREANRK